MTARRLAPLLLVLLTLVGCRDRAHPRRTWRPSDHAQPASQASPAEPGGEADAAPVSPEEARASAAAALFRIQCASCHGGAGRGDGPARAPVMQMPDLTSSEWQASRTDAQLGESIARGRNMMPPFGDRLSPDAIAALVEHVRRLATSR